MLSQRSPSRLRTVSGTILSLLVVGLGACASPPEPDTDASFSRERLGRIAVVAPQYPPTVQPNEGSTGEGALTGAGGVLAGCAQGGPYGMVYCAPLAVFAALTGASITSGNAPPAETLARVDERIRHFNTGLQARLRRTAAASAAGSGYPVDELADAGPTANTKHRDFRALAGRGFDTVLEVGIAEIGSKTSMTGMVRLIVTAQVRVIDLHSGRTLLRGQYRYYSEPRRADEWLRFEGKAIEEVLARANHALAGHVLDETLRLYPLAPALPARAEYPVPRLLGNVRFHGLRPIAPPWPRAKFSLSGGLHGIVDTPRPLLRWEAFPRAEDTARDPAGALARIRDVRYELRVARDAMRLRREDDFTAGVSVDNLRVPEYRLEQALEPQAFYRWTVRARFTLDGRERVTPWGQVGGGLACLPASGTAISVNQPNPCSYFFATGRWLNGTRPEAAP